VSELVVAGCNPAVGLLAAELTRSARVRLLPFIRSSRPALELLRHGVVHAAGIHLQDDGALAPGLGIRTIRQAVSAKLRWVGREPGSGARRCLDRILKDHHPLPKGYNHMAIDHTGVVETIRTGWAQAGVCAVAGSGGLDFLVAHEEDYDFCYRSELEHDPRIQALVRAIRSQTFRRSVDELPGYHASLTGEQTHVRA
jgi:molybdate-binding protein